MITLFTFNLTSNCNVARSTPSPLVNRSNLTNSLMKILLLVEFVLLNLPKQLPSSLLQKLKKSMLQVLTQAFVQFKITIILMHIPFVIVILFPYFPKYSNNLNFKRLNTSPSLTSIGVTIIFGSKRVMNG